MIKFLFYIQKNSKNAQNVAISQFTFFLSLGTFHCVLFSKQWHFSIFPGITEREALSDGENKSFRGWGTQGQLSLRDMSLSDDKILKRGTQGQLSLSDDKILERGTQGILALRDIFIVPKWR